jgi:hypothetical protein
MGGDFVERGHAGSPGSGGVSPYLTRSLPRCRRLLGRIGGSILADFPVRLLLNRARARYFIDLPSWQVQTEQDDKNDLERRLARTLHRSIAPSLHRSITPSLHHSIAPSLHHSISDKSFFTAGYERLDYEIYRIKTGFIERLAD